MKYFTKQLWADVNSLDDSVANGAIRQFRLNESAYRRAIRKLAPRLGSSGDFFLKDDEHGLHDARLLSLNISDFSSRTLARRSSHTWVCMHLLTDADRPMIYRLLYDDIQSINIVTANDLFSLATSCFGDWGNDELLAAGRDAFRHNILFSCGTEVSITFRKFRFRRTKASNKQIQAIAAKRGSA